MPQSQTSAHDDRVRIREESVELRYVPGDPGAGEACSPAHTATVCALAHADERNLRATNAFTLLVAVVAWSGQIDGTQRGGMDEA